jgi:uncharacterized protein YdhG (YjbR/CyaY superfamily)
MRSQKPENIDQYIESFSPDVQTRLRLIRETIRKAAPDVEESIRYGMPAFKLNKVHIYFSAYKKHIGMYPMYGMPELEEELKPFRGKDTKDAIHFQHTSDVPVKLISKIVKAKLKMEPD